MKTEYLNDVIIRLERYFDGEPAEQIYPDLIMGYGPLRDMEIAARSIVRKVKEAKANGILPQDFYKSREGTVHEMPSHTYTEIKVNQSEI